MKFAKELEDDLVPEWRAKYFNYKQGKKRIKAVSRALRAINKSPAFGGRPQLIHVDSSEHLPFTHYDFNRRSARSEGQDTVHWVDEIAPDEPAPPVNETPSPPPASRRPFPRDRRASITLFSHSPPVLIPQPGREESEDSSDSDDPKGNNDEGGLRDRPRYGSIVGSPKGSPKGSPPPLPRLELPDPALDPSTKRPEQLDTHSLPRHRVSPPDPVSAISQGAHSLTSQPIQKRKLSNIPKKIFKSKRRERSDLISPYGNNNNTKPKRAFTSLSLNSPGVTDSQAELYRELDSRQDGFFSFLDKELEKIDKFYRQKEDEANTRLQALREQLHEMRDRRISDLQAVKQGRKIADKDMLDGQIPIVSEAVEDHGNANGHTHTILKPITEIFSQTGRVGKTSKAMQHLGSPTGLQGRDSSQNRDRGDYVRRQHSQERVPYRFAKRRLKLALQEFYRGLELLKSYALLNRTALRKINKKYDKAVMARPPLQYMTQKVNHAHFVQSTAIEGHLVTVEDLYARYFERGNRKVAVNKLRSHLRSGQYTSNAFRNGMYVAAGTGFALSGIANGAPFLFSEDLVRKQQASFLFQLYGGYFLIVLLFLLFVLNCRIWTLYRINYIFVFEYDTRFVLDWRQLAEIPCFFLMLNGLFLWLNFQFDEEHVMYLYWPVVLIALTVVVIFLPFKVLYYRARKWWVYSNFRLLLAGLYPVEFRDFYLGDMYCSQTYSMSQLEVFFCLYAHRWNDPPQCNSNHSMLLGFFTTLPAIWRAFQCLRRYYDSRNWFPHLANFAKYCCNILYYMTLSLYRLNLSPERRAVLIVFAALNGIYCSFWDVFMDFSLGNPWSQNFLLRDNLAYRRKSFYYMVMITDVFLRQQWILYAILTTDLQHSAAMSFFVALAEVIRRGLWSLFRVENEHCNNVQKFRASRDVPLPYSIPTSPRASIDDARESDGRPSLRNRTTMSSTTVNGDGTSTSADLERAHTHSTTASSMRRRRSIFAPSTPGISALQRVGTAIAAAHSQDFEKRRRPEILGTGADDESLTRRHTSDDDDDDDDENDGGRESQRISMERRFDSRENVSGSAGASGSQPRRSRQTRSSYEGESISRQYHQSDDMDDAEIDEARERIGRAGN